jgi:hypothetical protein
LIDPVGLMDERELHNRSALLAAVERCKALLAGREPAPPPSMESSNLDVLCVAFELSPFERDLLVLCAGAELDEEFRAGGRLPAVTFSLALGRLPDAHWSALSPAGALRRYRLIEATGGGELVYAPLRIDEHVLHFLVGVASADPRIAPILRPVRPPLSLPPSQARVVERLIASWSADPGDGPRPVLLLSGEDAATRALVAAAAASGIGAGLLVLRAEELPPAPADREPLARLLERELVLGQAVLLLEVGDGAPAELVRTVAHFAERFVGPLIIGAADPVPLDRQSVLRSPIPEPSADERRALWHSALGALAQSFDGELGGELDRLAEQFPLRAAGIRSAALAAVSALDERPDEPVAHALWDACRVQARVRLDDLAHRIEPAAGWDDLVLPDSERRVLGAIAAHLRQRHRVFQEWGFQHKSTRGLGLSALFAGQSGTGKTMAAEVLARELRLDLYHVDLSQVVSKFIGETEKNLRRVFDAAEEGGAVLLFDEADALFGKRSEVRDSHDRYANIEVSYLLQRMEAYRGLAILTTNIKDALDPAFLRRLRFVVQFPFPDAQQRAQIWRRVFPAGTPTERLDYHKLARLHVAGGNIRNIALSAAFLAADEGHSVHMRHLLAAARSEFAKLDKPLSDADTAGWETVA